MHTFVKYITDYVTYLSTKYVGNMHYKKASISLNTGLLVLFVIQDMYIHIIAISAEILDKVIFW